MSTSSTSPRRRSRSRRKGDSTGARILPNPQGSVTITKTKRDPAQYRSALAGLDLTTPAGIGTFMSKLQKMRDPDEVEAARREIQGIQNLGRVTSYKLDISVNKRLKEIADEQARQDVQMKQWVDKARQEGEVERWQRAAQREAAKSKAAYRTEWTIKDDTGAADRARLLDRVEQLSTVDEMRTMRKQVWDDARRVNGPVSFWPPAVYKAVNDVRDALIDRQLAVEAAARPRSEQERPPENEPEGPAFTSNLTKGWNFNLKEPADLATLTAMLPKLTSKDDVQAMANYVETRAAAAWQERFRTWSEEAQTLMDAIIQREIDLTTPAAPTSWQDCARFADELPRRLAYRPPHPMIDHLRQRLGDQQRDKHPAVRVRRLVGDTTEYVDVDANNYATVLTNAQNRSWTDISATDRAALKRLTASWKGLYVDPKLLEARTQRWIERMSVQVEDWPDGEAPSKTKPEFISAVTEAARELSAWIEPEVLDEIGLPKIIVHPPTAKVLEGLPAYYDAMRREIHIGTDTMSARQVRHEFGHHVEEQSPVEVWCGLTAYLNALSEGERLVPPIKDSTRQPTYGHKDTTQVKLPGSAYALSYYVDAATELVALGLEKSVPGMLAENVDWDAEAVSDRDPRYVVALLRAIRPEALRKAGVTVPTLL